MKKIFTLLPLLSVLFLLGNGATYAQDHTFQAKNGMNVRPNNYQSFTPQYVNKDEATLKNNAGFENHPEIGMLYTETPCDNCYELIGKRTEKGKEYVKRGVSGKDGGKDIYEQTSSMPMHFKDGQGNWRTIKTKLEPDNGQKGVYAATAQEVPVSINTIGKYSALGKPGETLQFNRDLELIYVKADGSQVSLGTADWTKYTAGDDGVYVTNAWPGVDIEMHARRGSVKTNFIINNAMPQYADGQLLIRDHMLPAKGFSITGNNGNQKFTGNLEVRNSANDIVYGISFVTVFEKNNVKKSAKTLNYIVNGNDVDIELPGDFLNRDASSYPVIIDPLVSTATAVPTTGSTYSIAWTVPCSYPNAATTPANCTITDVQWSFDYTATGGAIMTDGACDFTLGACRSPGLAGYYWYCATAPFAGTCTGLNISIFSDVSACIPPPQCAPYNLNVTMNLYQNYLTTAPCASTYIFGATPYTITVIGHTVEINAITGLTNVCAGSTVNLSTSSLYGVPPYTYSWTPGPVAGNPAAVVPLVTTTYTATVTDACGITSSATQTIVVNPSNPITGPTVVCPGGTIPLNCIPTGGTWVSGTPSVATVGSPSGVVYGVAVGTSTITYTTIPAVAGTVGCVSTVNVTVSALAPITGVTSACVNATSQLSNTTFGGTWSSNLPGTASIDPVSGLVTGMAPGVATITYVTGAGCSSTTTFTVNPLPALIGGPSQVCQGSSVTLTDLSFPGFWSSFNTGIASVNSLSGVVTGVSAGNTVITYTLPTNCYIVTPITVNPTYSTSFNATICAGTSYVFAGTSYTTTGAYPHIFAAVTGCDSTATLNLTVIPTTYVTIFDSVCSGGSYFFGGISYSAGGTYNHTFANVNGCDSVVTLHLYIKPLPAAPVTSDLDYCEYATAVPLTASGSHLLWYTASTGGTGVPSLTPATTGQGVYTYYVSQTVDGCEGARAALNVTVHIQPPFAIVPAKNYECQYDTIGLYYSGPSFPGATYQWTLPYYAMITSGLATDPAIVAKFDTSLGGDFVSLTVGDGYAPCNITKQFSVPVFLTAPAAYFTVKPNVCIGDSVLIALNHIGTGINDFIWNFDGGNVVVASSNHGGPYKVVWNTPGAYFVTLDAVTSPYCPVHRVVDSIRVHGRPDAQIAPFITKGNGAKVCAGDSILFSPLHYDDRNLYSWNPAHYFNETNNNKIYGKVDNPGYITLTVNDPFGCTAMDSIYVNAEPCCTISFPTAFTPNGDGKNDLFRPVTIGNHEIKFFRIANRWGETVFETRNEHFNGWDGNYNGVPQDMGVYYFYISYKCGNGDAIEKGEVTLVR